MLLQGIDAMKDLMLLAMIFNLKQKVLLQDLKENFSPYHSIFWTVEYQKYRLLHCHILLFLSPKVHYIDLETINNYLCMEFPNLKLDPTGCL